MPPALDPRTALFLDLDGTLIEIAPQPELVEVPPGLPALLARLTREHAGAVAVVSGRPLAQIDALLRPWRGAAAGLHGIERRRGDGSVSRDLSVEAKDALVWIRPRLARLASGLVRLEDKGETLALHYRAASERETELCAAAMALCAEAGTALRLISGKMVLEFQPRDANKGAAIAAFLAEPPFGGRPAVFVGDDVTDEDGFAEIVRRGGIAIRVGPPGGTAATHALPSVGAVLAWLAR